ncbi:MAG: hypothetical protein NVS4B3_11960 [Gemmatimonadaceae bacterium]
MALRAGSTPRVTDRDDGCPKRVGVRACDVYTFGSTLNTGAGMPRSSRFLVLAVSLTLSALALSACGTSPTAPVKNSVRPVAETLCNGYILPNGKTC